LTEIIYYNFNDQLIELHFAKNDYQCDTARTCHH